MHVDVTDWSNLKPVLPSSLRQSGVHSTVYSTAQYTAQHAHTRHSTVYSTACTAHTRHSTVYSTACTAHTRHSTVYSTVCTAHTRHSSRGDVYAANQHPDQPKVQQLVDLLSMFITCFHAPLNMLELSRAAACAALVRGLVSMLCCCCMSDGSSVCLGGCIAANLVVVGHSKFVMW